MPDIHIAEQQLPANGEFVKPAFFQLPINAAGATFLLTYTAKSSSNTARPKWRVCWSPDGDAQSEDVYCEPSVEAEADFSDAPMAVVSQYEDVAVHPTVVPPNAIIRLAIPRARIYGGTYLRLEVGEYGDTGNPGTVSVMVMS